MEELLFLNYLQYQKNCRKTLWVKLCELPRVVSIFLFSSIVLAIMAAVAFIFPAAKKFWWIFFVGELFSCIVTFLFSDYYRIKSSSLKIDEYREYCRNLYNWLNCLSLSEENDIRVIYNRVKANVIQLEKDRKYKQNRFDKWMQILVIPAVLAILSTAIANQTDITIMVSYSVSILLFYMMIYSFIAIIKHVLYFPKKRKVEQMKCFFLDLQGVLDTQFLFKNG